MKGFQVGHKQSNTGRTHFKKGCVSLMKGKKHTKESKEKNRLAHLGHKPPKSAFKKGQVPWNYKGGKPTCLVCGIKLSTYKVKYCKKHSIKRGINNPKYIKDRTKLKKSEKKHLDVQYVYWMKEIKNRDSWKCKLNSNYCKGRLEAHHIFNWIDYPELRYVVNNGITLCHFHHPRGREEEKRMIPIFMELLSVSKE